MRVLALLACATLIGCATPSDPETAWQLGRVERLSQTQAAALAPIKLSPEEKQAADRLDARLLAEQEAAFARAASERAFERAYGGWPPSGWVLAPAWGVGWSPWGGPAWSLGWTWWPR